MRHMTFWEMIRSKIESAAFRLFIAVSSFRDEDDYHDKYEKNLRGQGWRDADDIKAIHKEYER